jgi:hypothetical protein
MIITFARNGLLGYGVFKDWPDRTCELPFMQPQHLAV